MFARNAFRSISRATAGRFYSSEAGRTKSSNGLLYGGLIAALGAGGYYYLTTAAAASNVERPKVFKGMDAGWFPLKVASTEDVNHDTKVIRFTFDDPNAVSGLTTASALLTKYQSPNSDQPTIRPYTSISEEDQPGFLDLLIKRYPQGSMTQHIHSLKAGDTLDFKGPSPKYPVQANQHNEIVLIAGGTGITPMYQLIRKVFNNPSDKTKVHLVYGNVTEEDILLRKELNQLEKTYPERFKAHYVLDKPPKDWNDGKGYITKDYLKSVLPDPKAENIKLFVCGPPGMYKAISGGKASFKDQGELTGYLKELGYDKDQVFKF